MATFKKYMSLRLVDFFGLLPVYYSERKIPNYAALA